jgi:hypothetical protein
MVPLVSLFSDNSIPEEVAKWKTSLDTALAFFETVKQWSIAAKRSGDAVTRLYAAYKTYASSLPHPPLAAMPAVPQPLQYQQGHAHTHFAVSGTTNGSAMMDPHAAAYAQQQPVAFGHYNPMMPNWANANANVNMDDPAFLNNFWDDMMWDTNLPDMLETPFGLSNEYDFAGAAQDSGPGGACWMHGN